MSKFMNRQITSTEIQVAEVVIENGQPVLNEQGAPKLALLPVMTEIGRLSDSQAKYRATNFFEKEVILINTTVNTYDYRMDTKMFMELAEKVEKPATDETIEEAETETEEVVQA